MASDSIMDSDADDAEWENSKPTDAGYTGKPCIYCGRIRVYERRDGRFVCEKCERFQDGPAPDTLSPGTT